MRPVLVRLPAVVMLSLLLAGAPALAVAMPVATTAEQDPVGHQHAPSAVVEGTDGTASTDDLEGMEGMDHGNADAGGHEAAGGHADGAGSSIDRPRVAVLSAFAGLNAAVLVVAAVVRRRDRTRPLHRPRAAAATTTA